MLSSRSLTLLGAGALYLSIAVLLYFAYPWAIALYPLSTLIFLWVDFRRDEEIHVIFIFMVIVLAAMLMYASSDSALDVGFGIELAGVVVVSFGLGLHRNGLKRERHAVLEQVQDLDAHVLDLERELMLYSTYENNAVTQIQLRRDLTEAAKSLGTTLDQKEVQTRLVSILEKRFPNSHVRIDPGQASDPLIAWAITNRASALVKDAQADERLNSAAGQHFRSAIVSPLMVMKRPFGFLRLENPQPGAYKSEDTRTVELFATLAGLTLENIQLFENVNDLATHDALTRLYTRRAFDAKLQEEVLRAGRSQMPLSLVMCDVDYFKRYNDSFGHQAGDILLRTIAGLLSQYARPVDYVARYGGEEFCLILPGYTRPQAVECADLIRIKISEMQFMFQNQKSRVTMSFGVSSFPQDAATPGQLVRIADERLYRAKQGGRNQVVG